MYSSCFDFRPSLSSFSRGLIGRFRLGVLKILSVKIAEPSEDLMPVYSLPLLSQYRPFSNGKAYPHLPHPSPLSPGAPADAHAGMGAAR